MPTRRDGHSSGTRIAAGLEQPTRVTGQETGLFPCGRNVTPIWSCSRWGLPCRPRCRQRGALLPHLFTLTRGQAAGGSFSVALSLGSPPPDVIRHRVSVEPGLSSPAPAWPCGKKGGSDRPTDWRVWALRHDLGQGQAHDGITSRHAAYGGWDVGVQKSLL